MPASEGRAQIRRMAGGDRRAFAEFYDRYATLAFTFIRRILPQPAEAEDVLQEVFWQAWREAAAYDERRGSPEAWLLNKARSRAIDRVRANRRRGETFVPVEASLPEAAPAGALANPAREAEDRMAARSAIALLPEPHRRVIEMAYFGGYTQEEIARQLGEPLGTVKTRMRAALERLRSRIGGAT